MSQAPEAALSVAQDSERASQGRARSVRQTSGTIAELVGGRLIGPADLEIRGVERLADAGAGDVTFLGDQKHADRWPEARAAAALVSRGLEVDAAEGRALIFVPNADLAMAKVLAEFAPPAVLPTPGVHPSAVVDPSAELGEGVRIGPMCVIGPGVKLGLGCVLHAQVTILAETTVGDHGELWPGVVIRERCRLGHHCIVHPNVVIGADGFGYRSGQTEHGYVPVKIPQIGTVRIGDHVEVGAGTMIDRGKFSATTIGDHTKIDNLVQVGHNCRIGRGVIIAGSCAIAGSVTIGDGAMLGGMVAVRDHRTIGRGARLAGCAQVSEDVPDGQEWGGSPAIPKREAIRQIRALRKLPDLVKQFKPR